MKSLLLFVVLASLSACASTPEIKKTRPQKSAQTRATTLPPTTPTATTAGGISNQETNSAPLMLAESLERRGEFFEAFSTYIEYLEGSQALSQKELAVQKARALVETKLTIEELGIVSQSSRYGEFRGQALFILAQNALEQRNTSLAKSYFQRIVQIFPATDLAFQAEQYIGQIESTKFLEPKTIGAILPLSGKSASVGQRTLRALQLGLGLHEPGSPLRLAVVDSEGNADTARRAVEKIIREDGALVIVGSLLSKEAFSVASKADELGVPTIGLSQKAGVTEVGPTVFRNAITSEMQVRQLVRSVMENYGFRRFAILAPNDSYGIEYSNIFWDEVTARGGSITAAQIYDPKETDFRAVCQRLAGTWYIEAREEEYRLRAKQLQLNSKSTKKRDSRAQSLSDDLLPALVDFDAIFIPDSAKMMGTMSAFLSYAGLRNVKLLGTNLWNTPMVTKRAGLFSDQLIFVDSPGFANEGPHKNFSSVYKQIFNEQPGLVEAQAFDTGVLIRKVISEGAQTREMFVRRLTDLKALPGVTGLLEVTSQREVKRPLVTYQSSQSGQINPIADKPRSF